jgi:hypothetical protein
MEVQKDKSYAALTGDAIKSSKLDSAARSQLHDAILKAGQELREAFPGLVVDDISVFRGDSVQFLLNQPGLSLRAALFFRAALKVAAGPIPADMRFAIGIGTIDFMPEVSKGGADGEAYRLSGPALDGMGPKQTLALALPPNRDSAQGLEALKTTVVLVGALAERWTEKQALAVKGALLGRTQDEIRKSWSVPVSRQAVAKNLDGACWFAVEHALQSFETTVN